MDRINVLVSHPEIAAIIYFLVNHMLGRKGKWVIIL